jgi:hypothetical protein
LENGVESLCRFFLKDGRNVRLEVHRDSDGGVAEHLLDDLGMDSALQHEGGARVPQIVKAVLDAV